MSYDLDLFQPQPGIAPIDIIQQAALLHASARTNLNQTVARFLQRENPNFQTKVTDEVIEIMDRIEGIRITLYAHGARVSIPFWFTDDEIIQLAFKTARQYIAVILTHTGYDLYDAQLGRPADIYLDLPQMIATYKQSFHGMQSFPG